MKLTIKYVTTICPETNALVDVPHFFIDGKRVTRQQYKKALKPPRPGKPAVGNLGYPRRSIAMGCHPSQVEEANAYYAENGVAARHYPDGDLHLPSRADQAKLVKLKGYYNRDGGYGD